MSDEDSSVAGTAEVEEQEQEQGSKQASCFLEESSPP